MSEEVLWKSKGISFPFKISRIEKGVSRDVINVRLIPELAERSAQVNLNSDRNLEMDFKIKGHSPNPSVAKTALKVHNNIKQNSLTKLPLPGNSPVEEARLSSDQKAAMEISAMNSKAVKIEKFKSFMSQPTIDLPGLKKLCWNGIPEAYRSQAWQLFLGYLPLNSDRRVATLERKRSEYFDIVEQHFSKGIDSLEYNTYHQIHIDIPRTNSEIPMYQNEIIQKSLERILYCWAIRHPASGYVQGINDVATPFFHVFLKSSTNCDNLQTLDFAKVDQSILKNVEADTFWCLNKLLDGIQDNYTFSQPGIQRQIQKLKDLVMRIDLPLYTHLNDNNVQFIQFAFRWINCLLIRELSIDLIIRMWDTYLSEDNGFSEFHTYVCAAFLIKFSEKIRSLDFQEMILFLQALPTKSWTEKDIELLLSESFMWKSIYQNAQSHLVNNNSS